MAIQPLKILFVNSETDDLILLRYMLGDHHEYDQAFSVSLSLEAIRRCKERKDKMYDMVILDYMFPGSTGLGSVKYASKYLPELRKLLGSVPILIWSDYYSLAYAKRDGVNWLPRAFGSIDEGQNRMRDCVSWLMKGNDGSYPELAVHFLRADGWTFMNVLWGLRSLPINPWAPHYVEEEDEAEVVRISPSDQTWEVVFDVKDCPEEDKKVFCNFRIRMSFHKKSEFSVSDFFLWFYQEIERMFPYDSTFTGDWSEVGVSV